MAQIYYKRVITNLMTIDEVPKLWRSKVEEQLKENEDAEESY